MPPKSDNDDISTRRSLMNFHRSLPFRASTTGRHCSV